MTARRLVLLRHAKAQPFGSVPDELRPLQARGRRQCAALGARFTVAGLVPELVLVSSAVRTRQTWELVAAALGDTPVPEVEVTDVVYRANVSDLLELVRQVDDRVRNLLVVGHEPAMSATAAYLAGEGDEALLARLSLGLSTGSAAVLEAGLGWSQLQRGTAVLRDLVSPES